MGVFDGYSIVALDFPEAYKNALDNFQYIFTEAPRLDIIGRNLFQDAYLSEGSPTLQNLLNPDDPSHLPQYRFFVPEVIPEKYIKSRIYAHSVSNYSTVGNVVAGVIQTNKGYGLWLNLTRYKYDLNLSEKIVDFFQIGSSYQDLVCSFVLTTNTLYVYDPITLSTTQTPNMITSIPIEGATAIGGRVYLNSDSSMTILVATNSEMMKFKYQSNAITFESSSQNLIIPDYVVFDDKQSRDIAETFFISSDSVNVDLFSESKIMGTAKLSSFTTFAVGTLPDELMINNAITNIVLIGKDTASGNARIVNTILDDDLMMAFTGEAVPTYNLTTNTPDSSLFKSFTSYMQPLLSSDGNFNYIWLDNNGILYTLTKDIVKTLTTILSYCTNDTTSPHTYTELYPHIRLESILDYELAGAEFQVYTTSSSAKAVRASDGKTLTASVVNGIATIGNVGYGTWTVTAGSNTATIEVKEFKQYEVFTTLNDYSWAEISAVSQSGDAANLFSVGDVKSIVLNGSVGNTTFSNVKIDVYILGINHNAELEGNNRIHFCIGKVDSKTIGLIDSQYNQYPMTSSGYFSMSYGNDDTAAGGWNGCYMRNSVMQWVKNALPTDLQNVLKTVTKYTDNTGGGTNNSSNVTATTEIICLEAEFEVQGARTFANSYEQNKQKQYDYYKNGNSKIRYKYNNVGNAAYWWNRSPSSDYPDSFCGVSSDGTANAYYSRTCPAVAPCFYV